MRYQYQIGGSLAVDAVSYVARSADWELYDRLLKGDYCYIFNSRQMGKSSLLVQTFHRLKQEGYLCAIIDLTSIGSEQITPLQWYKGLVAQVYTELGLKDILKFKNWWNEQEDFSYLQRLSRFIEELLTIHFPGKKIFIFIDEIDTVLSLDFTVDDLFALIRYCHERRTIDANYQRITFALSGVAAPSDLIRDRQRTPFNIGHAIALHNFQFDEVKPLLAGLKHSGNSYKLMQAILYWTGGQPFLTQKVCDLIASRDRNGSIVFKNAESLYVENIVKTQIINNWESQDVPEHFRTIRDRLFHREKLTGRLLGIYQQILTGQKIIADDSREHIELFLSGLIVKEQGYLKVKNPIYAAIFNSCWVETQLKNLRPYSQTFQAWINSEQLDKSRLLKGKALQDALLWSQGKSLGDLDYQFLAASQEVEREEVQKTLEAARLKEVQVRLAETEKRRLQELKANKLQRWLLTVASAGLVITSGLGLFAFSQYRRATLGEIKALVTSAEGLFNSNQRLDALVAAIKAKKKSSRIGVSDTLQFQVDEVLSQSLFGTLEYNRLSGETTSILDIDISSDGEKIVSASAAGSIKLWQRNGREIEFASPIQNLKSSMAISFSPDGNLLAIAGVEGNIKIYRSDGKLIREILSDRGDIDSIDFSPDSTKIASAYAHNIVKIWSVRGRKIATLKHRETPLKVVYNPDGNSVASGGYSGKVRLWNNKGQEIATFTGHQGSITALDFSPDDRHLISADDRGIIKIWDRQKEELVSIDGHNSSISKIVFHPDGNVFASSSLDGAIKLWNLNGNRLGTFLGHQESVEDIEFSGDGKTIVSAGGDGTIRFWQLSYPLRKVLSDRAATVYSLGISPDGKIIASGSEDGTIKLWHSKGTLINTLEEHQATVIDLAWSNDGQTLASAGADGTIKLWNRDGKLRNTLEAHRGKVCGVQFSEDDKKVYSGSLDGTVKQWTIDGQLLETWNIQKGVIGIELSPDDRFIAVATQGLGLLLYDINGKRIGRVPRARAWSETFSPDSKIIAIASTDTKVALWNWQEKSLTKLEGHQGEVFDIDFSPDGKYIISSSSDRTVKLWRRDGTLIKTLYGHDAKVRAVKFSPDGKYIVSGSADKTAMIWDIEQILNLDELTYACNLVRDYLHHNVEVEESDRALCDDVGE